MISSREVYIVLRPEGEMLRKARQVQKIIDERYHIYQGRRLPMIHITLARIEGDINSHSISTIYSVLQDIAAVTGPVEIILEGFQCFDISNRAVTLKLVKTDSLVALTDKIYSRIKQTGLNIQFKYKPAEIEYHITLVSSLFASRPLSEEQHHSLCNYLEGNIITAAGFTRTLELWHNQPASGKTVQKTCILGGN